MFLPYIFKFYRCKSLELKFMTAEDFDRDVENVGRLLGKSEVQGSTGLLLATLSLTGNSLKNNAFMPAFSQYVLVAFGY